MSGKKLKKSAMFDIKDFYLAEYRNNGICKTTLLISWENYYYDLELLVSVRPDQIDFKKQLRKYLNIKEGQISIGTVLEISKKYFGQFNKENIGQPKWWEPKVKIADTIPFLKVTNSFDDNTKNENNEFPL